METKCFKALGCISALGLGTSGLGGGLWQRDEAHDERHLAVLANALAKGIWVIDTSEVYGDGHAEELIGKALSNFGRGERDRIIVITKFWPDKADEDSIISSAKSSARRLGTYIDVFMPHGPTSDLCKTVRAMEKVVDMGLARFWGLSNVKRVDIEGARGCAKKYDIAAVENIFNFINKIDAHEGLSYAQREGILYIAASPLGRGLVLESIKLRRIANALKRTPAQIALRWLMDKEGVVPIPRTSRPERVLEFAETYGWRLPEEYARELDSL
ncbi:aldo/keto reductase [Thermoproteus tenax]|uniref:Oxidoreductase n=1 Tax=Thermoproteus tenax (strain ATCC 35583 / DSM 2078 / JCM 9277 / NBRC 100435 / Kra 1) TaxID=768679 RepID=G4RNL1_THETK|nr:aldo/keto reductase [Thermoproteus tenax]CCC81155.1 oxidoreductase [Thermoproteus tenax Kra 1]